MKKRKKHVQNRGIQTYVSIKQRELCNQNSCQISATVFTLVCLQKCSISKALCEFAHFSHYLRITPFQVIYNTHLLKKLHSTDCEFYFNKELLFH